MNDSEELFANGPPSMPKNARRLSDPGGRPSERRPKVLSRRQSDPGRGFSVFALRDTLRPVTQLSMDSRSDGGRRLSYAETSSATQSFVSFDTGPMDTPTHSAVALSTSSDAEPDVRNPYDHRTTYDPTRRASPARSNTARAPQVVGQRLDPRRAATQLPDPRQASAQRPDPRQASPQRLDPRQASPQRLDPRQVSPQRLDPRQTSPQGLAPRQASNGHYGPNRQPTHSFDPQDSGKLDFDPVPAMALESDAGDQTVRRAEVVPQRRGTREVPNYSQRRDARDVATDVPTNYSKQAPSLPFNSPYAAQEGPAPSDSDPRRSYKVSATPTVVPSRSQPPRTDDTSRQPIQESRQRLPSTGSNRAPESRQRLPSTASNRAAPTAPPPVPTGPPKAAPEPRQQDRPTAPTAPSQPYAASRPSTGSNRPNAAPTSHRPMTPPAPPRTEKPEPRVPRANITTQRPPLPPSASQMDTKYVNMLLAIDSIPPLYNILASFFTWILLAGFVLFPGTFTNLQEDNRLGALGISAVNVVKHVSLYVIAWVCTGVGAAGMLWLWYRWRANYIWLVNRVFMPGFLNSLAGVLSTLSSVLGTQQATFSISSKSTIITTSVIAGVCGILTAFYMFVLIRNIKKQHDREVGKQRAGKHGEGFADLTKRKIGV